MAARRPIVHVGGRPRLLAAGDTLPPEALPAPSATARGTVLPSDDFVVNEQGALGMYKATAAIGLTTPWESADSPAVAQPIIFERVGDLVHMRGFQIQWGGAVVADALGTPIGTVPAGFRPRQADYKILVPMFRGFVSTVCVLSIGVDGVITAFPDVITDPDSSIALTMCDSWIVVEDDGEPLPAYSGTYPPPAALQIEVMQTTGGSTTAVMSQASVTTILGDIETALAAVNGV